MIVAVIDTETTSLPRARAEIIEVGACLLEMDQTSGQVRARRLDPTFESLVQCSLEAWEHRAQEAMHVNGITEQQWRHAPFTFHVAHELQAWLQGHSVSVITSFNTTFDFARCFLGSRMWLGPRLLHSRLHLGPCLKRIWNERHLTYREHSLFGACHAVGFNLAAGQHNALHDARGAAELLVRDALCRELWWQRWTEQHRYGRADYTLPRGLVTRADVAAKQSPNPKESSHE